MRKMIIMMILKTTMVLKMEEIRRRTAASTRTPGLKATRRNTTTTVKTRKKLTINEVNLKTSNLSQSNSSLSFMITPTILWKKISRIIVTSSISTALTGRKRRISGRPTRPETPTPRRS